MWETGYLSLHSVAQASGISCLPQFPCSSWSYHACCLIRLAQLIDLLVCSQVPQGALGAPAGQHAPGASRVCSQAERAAGTILTQLLTSRVVPSLRTACGNLAATLSKTAHQQRLVMLCCFQSRCTHGVHDKFRVKHLHNLQDLLEYSLEASALPTALSLSARSDIAASATAVLAAEQTTATASRGVAGGSCAK